ncbi:MAG: nucleotidyltransferase family protein [Deltaproteobacteria bacterium]|nr:nucleotidyltransferase family protein [Deltaproteobacteria bacterium]MBW2389327.1 nucleotidyltransferase family protein [Deltaproteobacteria bacterium]
MSDKDPSSVHEPPDPVAALILAAGESARMGSDASRPIKALLPWRGSTLLRHCAEVALASRCAEVHVVVGANREALERELEGLDVQVIHHEKWQQGMGSTIALAIDRLAGHLRGATVLLCDQPFVTPELLDELIVRAQADGREIAACRYRGTLGPPAFFARSTFERLAALEGDRGAKSLLTLNPERVSIVDFPLGAFDIDTREDYDRALGELARMNAGSNRLEGSS